jgi:hypothetical protein
MVFFNINLFLKCSLFFFFFNFSSFFFFLIDPKKNEL